MENKVLQAFFAKVLLIKNFEGLSWFADYESKILEMGFNDNVLENNFSKHRQVENVVFCKLLAATLRPRWTGSSAQSKHLRYLFLHCRINRSIMASFSSNKERDPGWGPRPKTGNVQTHFDVRQGVQCPAQWSGRSLGRAFSLANTRIPSAYSGQ